jgi:hypothetical protein
MSPLVDVTKIYPEVYPVSTASFSFPPLPRSRNPRHREDMGRFALLPWTSESRQTLAGISEDPLPLICRPSTILPSTMLPLVWSTMPRTKATPRSAFMFVKQGPPLNLLEIHSNPFVDQNSGEVFGTIYSRLEPSWMRPGTSPENTF